MRIKFEERPDSRSSTTSPRTETFRYVLSGVEDNIFAKAYCRAATPLIYDGLYRTDVKLDHRGWNLWHVEVPYGTIGSKEPEVGEYKWNFDTTGQTTKKLQALEHIHSYSQAGVPATDHGGAIGVTEDGEVEGCEVLIPGFKWTETWQLSSATVTWAYSQILKAITGRTNNATFRGFGIGQVRFDGATGGFSNKAPDIVELTFNFTQSDDWTNITSGTITGISKKGWEYASFFYVTTEHGASNRKTKTLTQVDIDRVLDAADFSLLGIG